MDIYHKMFLVARAGELHRAPITRNYRPQRILDLGTGTGIWAIDMAECVPLLARGACRANCPSKYPEADVRCPPLVEPRRC